jgi:predicted RNase H-like nuclease
VEKRSRFWPNLSPKQRLRKIVENLLELRGRLSDGICNVDEFLPDLDRNADYTTKFLKSYEDLIDAVICALVGMRFAEGQAVPFGDEAGVIWIPRRKESDGKDA